MTTTLQNPLAELGITATTLPDENRAQLDRDGYTVFQNVIDSAWLEALREKFEVLCAEEGEEAGKEVHQMNGIRRLADLVNKGEVFDDIYVNPLVLAAAQHVIGRPFKLHSLNGHDPLPGYGQQGLHPDFGKERSNLNDFSVMNSLWILDDMSAENGGTRIVPGSQCWPGHPKDQLDNVLDAHPQEVYIKAPAGSVAVFNSHAWHGSTHNKTQRMRRVYHCCYIAREFPQQTNQKEYLRPETAARLSPAARYVLDV